MVKPDEKIDIKNTTDSFKKFVVENMVRKRNQPSDQANVWEELRKHKEDMDRPFEEEYMGRFPEEPTQPKPPTIKRKPNCKPWLDL
jgi:hypothetical protein